MDFYKEFMLMFALYPQIFGTLFLDGNIHGFYVLYQPQSEVGSEVSEIKSWLCNMYGRGNLEETKPLFHQ